MWMYMLLAIFSTFDFAAASSGFDFGDALALILGLIIGIIGFFACMGAHARRRKAMEERVSEEYKIKEENASFNSSF